MEDGNDEISFSSEGNVIIESIADVYMMEFNSIYRILLEEECCDKGIN